MNFFMPTFETMDTGDKILITHNISENTQEVRQISKDNFIKLIPILEVIQQYMIAHPDNAGLSITDVNTAIADYMIAHPDNAGLSITDVNTAIADYMTAHPASTLTNEDVINDIQQYFVTNPIPAGLTTEDVNTAITAYFVTNPIPAGLTTEDVNTAIADYMTAHPVSTLTTEDVNTAIADYMIAHPIPAGITTDDVNTAIADYMIAHPIPAGITTYDVNTAIADYMTAHPVSTLTTEDVNTAITAYMTNHPVSTLTTDDVNTAIADYMTAHPVSTLTTEDVNTAITAYFVTNPIPAGLTIEDVNTAIADYMIAHPIEVLTTDDVNNLIGLSVNNLVNQSINALKMASSTGVAGTRYYNGLFQYYNTTTSTWVNMETSGTNKIVVNVSPQPMTNLRADLDIDNVCIKLAWDYPKNTVVDGELICLVEGFKIVRKAGSAPTSVTDGTLVIDIKCNEFNKYDNVWFSDKTLSFTTNTTYYYRFYPYSDIGIYNVSSSNIINQTYRSYHLYGFQIDEAESDPSARVTYLSNCDNANYSSAYMDYTNDIFNYGDWLNAWFIRKLKPCMLKFDGTVDYELDHDDFYNKLNGGLSDVSNTAYGGNAMIGIPTVYIKVDTSVTGKPKFYFSDIKIDSTYNAYAHTNAVGNIIPYMYMALFDGVYINGKIRSLAGQLPLGGLTATQEVTYSKANNTGLNIWNNLTFSDIMLINLLIVLIGKSTDCQNSFGVGNCQSYISEAENGILPSGSLYNKGLFYGSNDSTTPVKIFGIENYWGNILKRCSGYICVNGLQKIKLTYGTQDGSTTSGYNETGNGYISSGALSYNGFINKMIANKYGLIPSETNGNSTSYYNDMLYVDISLVAYGIMGSSTAAANTSYIGPFQTVLIRTSSYVANKIGTQISCKTLS